jgi:hypothetical protein
MARAKQVIAPYRPHYTPIWVAENEWNGISVDEPVKILGERGDFIFKEIHVVDGTVTAVGVIGGPSGHKAWRFFSPERVTKIKSKRKRGAKPQEESNESVG